MVKSKDGGEDRDVPIEIIQDNVICRASLNQDDAYEWAILMEQGVEFPRIKVIKNDDGTYTVRDGRTRLLAYGLAKIKMIPVTVYPKASTKDILFAAIRDNYGQGNGMSFADVQKDIIQFIEMGVSHKSIVENLPYPKTQIHRMYAHAYSAFTRRKCIKAMESMRVNTKMSMEEAARLFSVTIKDMQNFQKGITKRGSKYSSNNIKGTIQQKFKSIIMFSASTLRQVMERYQNGEVGITYVNEILGQLNQQSGNLRKNLVNWENRFSKIDERPASQHESFSTTKIATGYIMKPSKNN
jgi:hypothetical protein